MDMNYIGTYNIDISTISVEKWNILEEDNDFKKKQDEYIKEKCYNKAVKILAANYYHVNKHSLAIKNVIFARSEEMGSDKILPLFTEAVQLLGYDNLSYIDSEYFDKVLIEAIYKVLYRASINAVNWCENGIYSDKKGYVKGELSTIYIAQSRYENEGKDALLLLTAPLGYAFNW